MFSMLGSLTFAYTPPTNPFGSIPSIGRALATSPKRPFSTNSAPASVDCKRDKNGGQNKAGDPILLDSGSKIETFPFFSVQGEKGLSFSLLYNSGNAITPWTTNLDYMLDTTCSYTDPSVGTGSTCSQRVLHRPDGSMVAFSGGINDTSYPPIGGGVTTLTRDPASGNYTLHDDDGATQVYTSRGKILSITDMSGVGWTYTYGDQLTSVTHTNGQSISFSYSFASGSPATVTVVAPSGAAYTYTGNGILPTALGNNGSVLSISYPGTPATVLTFKYANSGSIGEIDYNGTPYSLATYDTTIAGTNSDGSPIFGPYWGWATSTSLADGSGKTLFSYGMDSNRKLVTTVTNPLGHVAVNTYAGVNGQLSSISDAAVSTCGATAHTRLYDNNGNLSQTVDNNGNVHTYSYAANGQLQTETEAAGTSLARTTDYVWDPNASLNRLLSVTVEGVRKIAYTYNAQNRLASVAITNLSTNGTTNQTLTTTYQYTLYGNGMVKTMLVTKPSTNGSDVDTYQYDSLGNLVSFANGLGQSTTYTNYNGLGQPGTVTGPNGDAVDYVYDSRGRISTKTTHPNGGSATWTYGYDGFGLLSSLSEPDGQVTTWNRNQIMQVASVNHNDKDGTSTESFQYDANGDVSQHSIARGSTTSLIENYTYDGLGRLYQRLGQHGQSLTYAYDGNGNVLSITNAVGHVTSHQYDALNRVTQTVESGGASPPIPSGAPGLNAPASNASGSYTVSWNSIPAATSYVLQQQVNGGAWSTVQSNSALSWSASGKANGTYGYRAQACNSTGCGPWSGTTAVSVSAAPPAGAPTVSVPGSSNNGTYTVSWTTVANAAYYNLQELATGGSWTTAQPPPGSTTSWPTTGRGNGTYSYQAQACNTAGCGPWSSAASIVVSLLPAAPTSASITERLSGKLDVYTGTWSASSLATRYEVLRIETGASVYSGTALTVTLESGLDPYDIANTYQVRACNDAGCSGWTHFSGP